MVSHHKKFNKDLSGETWTVAGIFSTHYLLERLPQSGAEVITRLSQDMTKKFSRGFSERNLEQMRKFYILFSQIPQTLSGKFEPKLSWSHYCELLKVEELLARKFYEQEAIQNNWSIRELKRQIIGGLSNRAFASKYKLALPSAKELTLKLGSIPELSGRGD